MRLRRDERMDPAVAAELEELVDELALDVRTERPVPDREFAARLDGLVRAGFSQPKEQPAFRPRRVALAFGAAATLFIGVTAVVTSGVLDSGGGESRSRETRGLQLEAPSATSRDSSGSAGGAVQATPSPAVGQGVAPRAARREREHEASLTLAADRGEVESVADGVIAVTDRYRGFVLSSNVRGGDGREAATLDLRIPSRRLQSALADLSELAHVRSRTQSTFDVTARVASLRERLRDALADRRVLLARLGQAVTDAEAASLRARMRIVNRRIARIRNSFRSQRNRVDYAEVAVAVETNGDSGSSGDGWSLGDALGDARQILTTGLAVLVVTLAVAIPVGLLLTLGWAGSRRWMRSIRERTLDSGGQIENRASR